MRTKVERWMLVGAAIVVLGACVEIAGIEEAHPEDNRWANWLMPNPVDAGLPNKAKYALDTPGTGMVTDTLTGLIWQRDIDSEIDSGLFTWADAKKHCDELTLGGFTDWRLPSRIELVSIVDFTQLNPAIDTTAFPDTPIDGFWTSSPAMGSPNDAGMPSDAGVVPSEVWYVHFFVGNSNIGDENGNGRVRCVR